MDTLSQIIKAYLIPGSLVFFMLGCGLCLVLIFIRRTQKWGRALLISLLAFYYVCSTPSGVRALENRLSREDETVFSAAEAEGVQAIVVLGGGGATFRGGGMEINTLSEASILRVIEGVRLFNILEPEWLILSGGTNPRAGVLTAESLAMREAAIELGVPEPRIAVEAESDSTYQQALHLRAMMEQTGIHRFVLVTSPMHMPRALATFQAQGMRPIPSQSRQHGEGFFNQGHWALPTERMLRASAQAFRELLALTQYRLLGRMAVE
jgi:uncharacterized SAM-binding protein YcdF (DUF218 family)